MTLDAEIAIGARATAGEDAAIVGFLRSSGIALMEALRKARRTISAVPLLGKNPPCHKDLTMNSIVHGAASVVSMAFLAFCEYGTAQIYAPSTEPDNQDYITANDLSTLAEAAYEVRQFEDNRMLYDQAVKIVQQKVQDLSGLDVVINAKVKQVTYTEVLLSLPADMGAWFTILPPDSPPSPDSLHAKHRDYPGPPSTRFHNILSVPQTIEIGQAIRLEDALGLRKGDMIRIIAKVNEIESDVPTSRISETTVFLKDVRVFYEDEQWWQKTGGILNVQSIPGMSDPERASGINLIR